MKPEKRGKTWRVRWTEGKRPNLIWHSDTFDAKEDAQDFIDEIRQRRRRGALSRINAGKETLNDYVKNEWVPTYIVQLAPKTQAVYTAVFDQHIAPTFGNEQLRNITPEMIARWQSDSLRAGAGPAVLRKAFVVLGGILQRAAESRRIDHNPARVVRKVRLPNRPEVVPLKPITIEKMRAACNDRDAVLLSVLAYSGLRPGEALGLQWGDIRERTILVQRSVSAGQTKTTKTGKKRTVRLLDPLRRDLAEWRMRSGRPDDRDLVFPGHDGNVWTEAAYQSWRRRTFARAAKSAGLDPVPRPYDLRHSFASLLLHEGRNVIDVARQLGHGANLTLSTYGHVLDEVEDAPRHDAESLILSARDAVVAQKLPKAVL